MMEPGIGQDCQLPQQSQVTDENEHDLSGCNSSSRLLLVADKAVSCSIESSDKSVSTEDNFES